MQTGVIGVADRLPGVHFPAQRVGVEHPGPEALAAEQGELNLGHV